MSSRAFWAGVGLLVGGLVVLPALLVGLLAVGNGLATGNGRLAGVGAGFAGGALVLAGLGLWLARRARRRALGQGGERQTA